eukprot:m.99357 g.99357  ORF g.99357 m.99357 type:complete len:596 (+) comp13139_c0_seq3:150-1937(+)
MWPCLLRTLPRRVLLRDVEHRTVTSNPATRRFHGSSLGTQPFRRANTPCLQPPRAWMSLRVSRTENAAIQVSISRAVLRRGLLALSGASVLGMGAFLLYYPFAGLGDVPPAEKAQILWTAYTRFLRDSYYLAQIIRKYQVLLQADENDPEYARLKEQTHFGSAELMKELFCINGGVYIKLGQMIAVLDYVIPYEYITTMAPMFDKAAVSSYEEVERVVEEDLGKPIGELFTSFEKTPIASASLAQVHRAVLLDGTPVAVKVQHRGLKEESQGDLLTVETMVNIVKFFFPNFDYTWLIEEAKLNLPLEMDFTVEARNAETCRDMFARRSDISVPDIMWQLTSSRVLTMSYEEGIPLTDQQALSQSGLDLQRVSTIVTEVFSEQIFVHGMVHCDPHPGNLLLRRNHKGEPHVVLLDHGLYRRLPEDFRDRYSRLWRSLILGDAAGIHEHAAAMNAGDLYPVLASMLTYKEWSDVIAGDSASRLQLSGSEAEKAYTRSKVAMHFREINEILRRVSRDLLLLLKTNDCLHGLESRLKQAHRHEFPPGLTHTTMARYCLRGTRIQPTWSAFLSAQWDMLTLELRIAMFRAMWWWMGFTTN